jgi:hypothetical protein
MDAPSAREVRRRQGSCGIPRHKQPWHTQHDEVALAIQHALCCTPRACKQQPMLGCSLSYTYLFHGETRAPVASST